MKSLFKNNIYFFEFFIACVMFFGCAAKLSAQTTSLFTDGSLTAKTVTAYGDAKVTAGQSKFSGPVGVFDGAGDYLVVSPSPLDTNPKIFTIEAWVNISSVPANGWPIVSQNANGATGEQQLFVSGSNGGAANLNKLRFYRGADATNPIDLVGTTALPLNQWIHIALSVDGVTAKLFVNGNLDASVALTTGWVDTAQAFYIGTVLNTSAPQNQSFAKGKVSDFRITKNKARYRNSFLPAAMQVIDSSPIDANYADTALILKANGSNNSTAFPDESVFPKSFSVMGNTQLRTSKSKYGNASLYFDGNADYLSFPDSEDYFFASDDVTMEAWIYPESFPSSGMEILAQRSISDGSNFYFLRVNSSGKIRFVSAKNGSIITDIASSLSVPLNTWTHVAITRKAGLSKIWINGSSSDVVTSNGTGAWANINYPLLIGSGDEGSNYFTGYIDDLRITKGVARYISNFTPAEIPATPTKVGDTQWSNVSFLVNANGTSGSKNFFDLSSWAKPMAIVGDTKITTAQSKFGGASAVFDGNGDYLSLSSTPALGFGAQDFTIEMFVNPTVSPALDQSIVLLDSRYSMGWSPFTLSLYGNTTGITFGFFGGSVNGSVTTSAPTISLNTWTHLALVRQKGVMSLYVNGVKCTVMRGSETGAGAVDLGSALPLKIGIAADNTSSAYSGYIDDLRITKGVARYTGTFAPPTTQLEPSQFVKDPYSNRVSLLLLSGAAAVDNVPPYVSSSTKQTNTDSTLSSITLNFSKSMEATSFTADQFSMVDATQKVVPISFITKLSNTSFRLGFTSPLFAGAYTFTASPQLIGANGLSLDQNKNGTGGELADSFQLAVTVSSASPSVVAPAVSSSGTGTGINLSWPAYVTPVNGKDISKYRVYISPNPYTNISQATKILEVSGTTTSASLTGLLSNTTYYVSVVAVDVSGAFTSTVSPVAIVTQGATEQATSYTYNTAGQILTEDGPRTDVNDVTTYTYDASGNRATMTNALGHMVSYTSYDGMGRLLSVTDANGIISNFTYNDRGWLLSSTVKHPTDSSLDSTTTYTYDPVGLMLTMTLPNGYQLGYEYDDARRLTAIKNLAGERIEYTLDAAGNRTQQKIKNSSSAIVYSVAQAFDELSRVMSITGNHSQNEQHKYDANDNKTEIVDGRANKTRQTYDALNRITKVIDPALKETGFTYDTQDRVKTVTDARGNITTYNYDGLGNLISLSSPDTGVTRYSYDAAGNRTSMIDARGVVVNYTYDALNRLTAVSYPAASAENVTYTYDDIASGNYGLGRLTKVAIGSTSVAYVYNHLGLISKKTTVVNSLSRSTSYTYDTAGNLASMTYPSGRVVNYVRDSAGRVQAVKTKINASAAEQTVVSAVSYLPFGPTKSFTYGNGLTHTITFDSDYRLTDIVLGGLMVRNYSYDAADNITKITDGVSSTKTQDFTYDNLDRLTSANGTYGYQAFSYDSVGNRTGFLADNGAGILSDTYSYESTSNRLSRIDKTSAGVASGARTFTYDNAGNRIQGTGEDGIDQAYTYNNTNRLNTTKVNASLVGTYAYNALGQRVSKTYADNSKELFHYDEVGQLIAVTNASGAVQREYIYNGNTLVGYINAGVLVYVHNDHHNTPQVITAQNQSVLWMADYEPFGKAKLNANNTIAFSARFPGQYLDSETGIYYNYFRDYDPSIGSYIESDPIGLGGGINTYAYVDGNPLMFTDPFGLEKIILLPRNDLNFPAAAAAPDIPGSLTIYSHGNPHRVNGMDASALAEYLKNGGVWKPGMPVKLDACRTAEGDNNIAKDLADKLNVPVTGPNARTLTSGERDLGPWHSWNIPFTERTIPYWPGKWVTYPETQKK